MGILDEKNYEDVDIYTFQERCYSGVYTDQKVRAKIVVQGEVAVSYHLYIDRRVVTSAGCVISPKTIVEKYGAQHLKIRIWKKKFELPSLTDYKFTLAMLAANR